MAEALGKLGVPVGALLALLAVILLALNVLAPQVGRLAATVDLWVRHRHDDHIVVRHGVRGLTAVTALKVCSPLEVWYCPGDGVRPETFIALCKEQATNRVAVGVISATPRSDGQHVLLTAYIADSHAIEVARLTRRGCVPVAGIEIRWP